GAGLVPSAGVNDDTEIGALVVNEPLVACAPRATPSASRAAVETRMANGVEPASGAAGCTVKTVLPALATGAALICTQVPKPFDESWIEPLQLPLAVLVVMLAAVAARLKVTTTGAFSGASAGPIGEK